MKNFNKVSSVRPIAFLLLVVLVTFSITGIVRAVGPTTVSLGVANSFGVLAGSGITNTGASTVNGDVGSYATTTQTGFSGGNTVTITGTNHLGDSTTQSAKTDLTAAFVDAAGRTPATTITASSTDSFGVGTITNGGSISPGVYNSGSTIGITGTLILDGGGDPNAVFIFQAGSSLTTASASHVSLINGAQACNVFWKVGTSATLGTTSDFKGTILADQSITDTDNSTIVGRLLASVAHVTLSNTVITVPTCAPSLSLQKTVTNDNGGTALNTAWTLTATGASGSPTNLSGTTPVTSDATFTNATFKADTYTLGESGGSAGYTAGTYSCVKNGGGPVISNSITIVAGDTAVCTVNNDDTAAHLIVIKHVINDNGGVAVASAFSTTISGVTTAIPTAVGVESPGVDNILTSVGSYSVDEGVHSGYNETLSTDCSGTIALGETKTCTITNDDIPPTSSGSTGGSSGGYIYRNISSIDIIKTPSSLTLPAGINPITYNYTVWNGISILALTDVTVSDDKCMPVTFLSGDTNNNKKLDPGENWKYSCTTTLSQTTTNTATATGYSNDIYHRITTATAIATVVVSPPRLPKTGFTTASTFGQQVKTIESRLAKGSKGGSVMTLQRFLISENKGSKANILKNSGADGKFGLITQVALGEWQTANNLVGDGIFGSKTRAYLSSHY